MAQVTLSIGGMKYAVGCQDGQESHLRSIAREVEKRLETVRNNLSPSGENHAFFLTALILADELHDQRKGQTSEEDKAMLAEARRIVKAREREERRLQDAADMAEGLTKRLEDYTKRHELLLGHDVPKK